MKIDELREQLEHDQRLFKRWNDWSLVEAGISAAIERVLAYDSALLEDRTGERSIAHRLAVYVEREFPGWHVDCEFNRQGELDERGTKRVTPRAPLLIESRPGQGSVDVTPDIIVHQRRRSRNLVAIEVKPSGSADLEKDRAKLRQYLSEPHLKYAFAVLVTYRDGEGAFEPLERITE